MANALLQSRAPSFRLNVPARHASAVTHVLSSSFRRPFSGLRSTPSGVPPGIPPELLNNPEVQARIKAYQEALSKPEVQQQVKQMQEVMQNQQLQARIQELRKDPELAGVFEELQKGGIGALQKFWNDPKVLAKFSEKISDLNLSGQAAGAQPAAPQPPVPEITTLLEAARYGDAEAIEDFLAIGKDVNMVDSEQRTPLHFAVAYARKEAAQLLIANGANLEAQDSKANTPLHYAAGYGREELVDMLLAAGANISVQNATGKTPADLARLDSRNPISRNDDLLAKLTGSS